MAICKECGTGLEGTVLLPSERPRNPDGTFVCENGTPLTSTEKVQRFRKRQAGVQSSHGGRPIASKAWSFGIDDEHLYTPDELEFLKAISAYKQDNRRPFPTWSEVLAVFTSLGYRKGVPS